MSLANEFCQMPGTPRYRVALNVLSSEPGQVASGRRMH
jgi:hypothetical protein